MPALRNQDLQDQQVLRGGRGDSPTARGSPVGGERPPGGGLDRKPPRIRIGGDAQNRTGDGGFADLCLATWLRRPALRDPILPSLPPTSGTHHYARRANWKSRNSGTSWHVRRPAWLSSALALTGGF